MCSRIKHISILVIIVLALFLLFSASRPDRWILTQYSDATGNQSMFYSLVNERDKTLILIDGGWTENAANVETVINENGGQVAAWFMTHYHEDHCGAFNALWPKYRDNIDVVYTTPLIWEDFIEVAQYWDTPETFSTFLEQTGGQEILYSFTGMMSLRYTDWM